MTPEKALERIAELWDIVRQHGDYFDFHMGVGDVLFQAGFLPPEKSE